MAAIVQSVLVFMFGSCIGSFLNVCIYRLPAGESIVWPGSRCPRCGHAIRFYDNVPVLSYLLLLGRCRYCRSRIALRYPLVEVLGGLSALAVVGRYGFSIQALYFFVFIAVLLLITFIDIDHRVIPDIITLPGIPFFLAGAHFASVLSIKTSLLGLLIGGGILFLIAVGYQLLAKKEGMGGGDIKLLAMIGTAIGWKGVLFTIFSASAFGTLAGVVLMIRQREGLKLAIPFGPFLALGAALYIFFGPRLIAAYLNFLH